MLPQSEVSRGARRYPADPRDLRLFQGFGRLDHVNSAGGTTAERAYAATHGQILQFNTFVESVSPNAAAAGTPDRLGTAPQAPNATPRPVRARAPAVANLPAPSESAPTLTREPLVNARELAHILGVPLGLVHRKSAEGVLPRHKIGHRTVRYDVAEVRLALQAPRWTPAPQPPIPRRRIVEPGPVHDLPAYDWPPRKPPDATLPPADRRGSGRS